MQQRCITSGARTCFATEHDELTRSRETQESSTGRASKQKNHRSFAEARPVYYPFPRPAPSPEGNRSSPWAYQLAQSKVGTDYPRRKIEPNFSDHNLLELHHSGLYLVHCRQCRPPGANGRVPVASLAPERLEGSRRTHLPTLHERLFDLITPF